MSTRPGWYSVEDAAKLCGITTHLLRAWEARYGWPRPLRDANGHRRYSATTIDEVIRVRAFLAKDATVGLKDILASGWPVLPSTPAPVLDLHVLDALPQPARPASVTVRAALVEALARRHAGDARLELATCACRVHPGDRELAGWRPCLVVLEAWDALGEPMVEADALRALVRQLAGERGWQSLQEVAHADPA